MFSMDIYTFYSGYVNIATGYIKMTSIDHLPGETKVFPVDNHLSVLFSQYLTRNLQNSNPS